ncbi:MAG: hypothetical protein FD143_3021 [Ignavibacteria bacterium]|nr:MAG: hypothetical protein FD143_3021 [Ignavibacteria bacterium]KAF0154932.1 MAG: hypothetical protein FD188_3211 [Ignavibacteria bacterium]
METKAISVQTQKSLSIVQFISSNIDTFDYVSLGRAASEKMIELVELKDGASVNDIFVINHSDKYIFMMDGDIIEGAKQNRVINTSVLLAPKVKTQVHVSCVEQGRWHHVSESFTPSDYVAPANMRQMKNEDVLYSIKLNKKAYADQGKVWSKVAENHKEFDIKSQTQNLSDLAIAREDDFKKFIESFKSEEGVNGIALFNGNKFVGLDLFNCEVVFQEYFPKTLKGAAMQFLNIKAPTKKIDESELKYKLLETMDKIEGLQKATFNGVGVGAEDRFQDEKLNGFALMFDKKLIHLTAMQKN